MKIKNKIGGSDLKNINMHKRQYNKPFFVNGDFKWYEDEKNQSFLESKNSFNLPSLDNLKCCIVINKKENIEDFVLIDYNQNILCSYPTSKQHEYETKIKMFKIKKYYDEHEGIKSDF